MQPFPATGRRYAVTEGDSLSAALSAGPLRSVDGTELFYETIIPNQIVAMDVTTVAGFINGTERPLPIERFFDAAPYRDYDMMPDGQRFLVAFPADQTATGGPARLQINIVLNWFEELRERVPVP